MPTQKQIDANRRNAQKCTGPRTEEGKQNSRLNALKSGVHAQSTVIPGEDPAELETLRAEYYDEHVPMGTEERLQVDSMIRVEWQLRRLARVEAEIYLYKAVDPSPRFDHCRAGQLYFYAEKELARLTRQVATYQRCYRDAAAELKKLQAARPAAEELAETKPISDTTPVAAILSENPFTAFQIAPERPALKPAPVTVPAAPEPARMPLSGS